MEPSCIFSLRRCVCMCVLFLQVLRISQRADEVLYCLARDNAHVNRFLSTMRIQLQSQDTYTVCLSPFITPIPPLLHPKVYSIYLSLHFQESPDARQNHARPGTLRPRKLPSSISSLLLLYPAKTLTVRK